MAQWNNIPSLQLNIIVGLECERCSGFRLTGWRSYGVWVVFLEVTGTMKV